MKLTPAAGSLIFSIPAILHCSCASVSVKGVQDATAAKPKSKPAHIYVERFGVGRANVKENPMRRHAGKLSSEARELVAMHLVKQLTRHIAPASLVAPGAVPRAGGWLVSGEFTRIQEGSRFWRMAIGLGMGRTYRATRVAVRNLPAKNRPFLTFDTTGGSGASPGAATNPIPFSSVPTALFASQMGVTDDAQRTARMIAGEIAHYAAKRGWIPATSLPKVKHARTKPAAWRPAPTSSTPPASARWRPPRSRTPWRRDAGSQA